MNELDYIDYYVCDGELSIMEINIPKKIRRKGIGSKLVKSVISKHRNKIHSISVPCSASEVALLFWLSLGFKYFDKEEEAKARIVFKHNTGNKILDIEDNSIIHMIKKT